MKTLLTIPLLGAALAVAGCSSEFIVRSPDQYRDATKAVLDAKADSIRSCYDGVLKTQPGTAGTVQVHFMVARETGKISGVRADAARSTAPAPVQQCVVQTIEGLQLTPPDKLDGDATFTMEFQAPAQPRPAGA